PPPPSTPFPYSPPFRSELRERLKNQFFFFGDDMVRTGAIGEWAAPFATPSSPDNYAVWYESQRLVAKAGWRNENAQAGTPTSSESEEHTSELQSRFDLVCRLLLEKKKKNKKKQKLRKQNTQ